MTQFDSFDEYQLRTGDTDIIKPEARLAYYPLGLCGEVGETIEKMGDVTYCNNQEINRLIALELGDVMWYVARLAVMLDISMSSLADDFSVQGWQMECDDEETSVFPDRIHRTKDRMTVCACKIADCTKKAIRDNNSEMAADKRIEVITSLIGVMKSVAILSAYIGVPLSVVLGMNFDKLVSRKVRGMIGGSGDER